MTTRLTTGIGAAVALAAVLVAAGCGGGSQSTTAGVAGASATRHARAASLVGAGSTLVAPLVGAWQQTYQRSHGVAISYGAIGSGGGIAQVTARTVDFGASDAPLTPDQRAACKGCVEIPWALAATTVAYDLHGVGHLRLTGPVLAEIFLGRITTWNDRAIARLNPGVALPAERIATLHRSDGSGDTYAFTDYLSRVSPAWKAAVGGASTQVSWPVGTGAKGNAGVAAALEQTPGAIAYVAIGQAKAAHLSVALLRNRAGRYPAPDPATIAAAAATARFAADHSASIVDPPASAADAYPLSTFTYAIVPTGSPKLATLKAFLDYAVTGGQRVAPQLSFAPLPRPVAAKDEAIVAGL